MTSPSKLFSSSSYFADALVLRNGGFWPPSVKRSEVSELQILGCGQWTPPISILTANQHIQPDPALQLCQLQNT